ncbi:hypothetical protein K456DRAFT_1171171 [Colletotrichum gloeosporioides 23]|nr:hypothetical protein K456DRAFT_1171171 [Colletotrichum gloeosporioides 23]
MNPGHDRSISHSQHAASPLRPVKSALKNPRSISVPRGPLVVAAARPASLASKPPTCSSLNLYPKERKKGRISSRIKRTMISHHHSQASSNLASRASPRFASSHLARSRHLTSKQRNTKKPPDPTHTPPSHHHQPIYNSTETSQQQLFPPATSTKPSKRPPSLPE